MSVVALLALPVLAFAQTGAMMGGDMNDDHPPMMRGDIHAVVRFDDRDHGGMASGTREDNDHMWGDDQVDKPKLPRGGKGMMERMEERRERGTSTESRMFPGFVKAVATSSSAFTLGFGNRSLNVQTNSSTLFITNGTTTTFATLKVGDKVRITTADSWNATTTTVLASKVVLVSNSHEGKDMNGMKGMMGGMMQNQDNQGDTDHQDQGEKRGWSRFTSFFGKFFGR